MKPEEKAAVKTGATTALITTAVALLLPSPAAWAAAIYGTYKMAKGCLPEDQGGQGPAGLLAQPLIQLNINHVNSNPARTQRSASGDLHAV